MRYLEFLGTKFVIRASKSVRIDYSNPKIDTLLWNVYGVRKLASAILEQALALEETLLCSLWQFKSEYLFLVYYSCKRRPGKLSIQHYPHRMISKHQCKLSNYRVCDILECCDLGNAIRTNCKSEGIRVKC
jgi:hypothetical protein